MDTSEIKLALSALLSSIGKLYYRGNILSGEEFAYTALKNKIELSDETVLNTVRNHKLKTDNVSSLQKNDFAFIVNFAEQVADAADFKKHEFKSSAKNTPLSSIFNRLNGNKGTSVFAPVILGEEPQINFPTDAPVVIDPQFYRSITEKLESILRELSYTRTWFNSFLSKLEALTTFVPASASDRELADISFYDHAKITAAIASCIYQYLDGDKDYKTRLYSDKDNFLKENVFMLFSMDISGIQNFIYTISSKGALKSLRARSFYLEILMEHVIDELLERLSLTRANLIYSGGGHCYILLQNNSKTKELLESFKHELNLWFMKNFDISIYVAFGYAPCSVQVLENKEQGSLSKLYHEVSVQISKAKLARYSATDILSLNNRNIDGNRECRICHRTGKTDDNETCYLCSALIAMSKSIQEDEYFVVLNSEAKYKALPLPFGAYLVGASMVDASILSQSSDLRRMYVKNKTISAKYACNHLWIGDYSHDNLDAYAEMADGISRIGVMRADVDNLGVSFAFGFRNGNDDKYATLSRSATLSRMLSLFFKYYINSILTNGENFNLTKIKERKLSIVYSGGDDVFLAGAWNDVIDAFTDLRQNFRKYCQNTLSISGGVGIYPGKFPIKIMAEETENLVECSKNLKNKNGITLFEKGASFDWERFIGGVINDKFRLLKEFFKFSQNDENSHLFGNSFLYNLLDLMRNSDVKINRARLVYLLSRMEPSIKSSDEEKENYRKFSQKIYEWYPDKEHRKELISASYLYSYIFRDKNND